jgi:hypothetical protein
MTWCSKLPPSDTSVVHLAGALGKEICVLLQSFPTGAGSTATTAPHTRRPICFGRVIDAIGIASLRAFRLRCTILSRYECLNCRRRHKIFGQIFKFSLWVVV